MTPSGSLSRRKSDGCTLDTCGDLANPPRVEPKPSNLGRLDGSPELSAAGLSMLLRLPPGTDPRGAMLAADYMLSRFIMVEFPACATQFLQQQVFGGLRNHKHGMRNNVD